MKKAGVEKELMQHENADKIFGKKVPLWIKILLVVSLLVVIAVSFMLGRYGVLSPSDIYDAFYIHFFRPELIDPSSASYDATLAGTDRVIFNIRLPRIMLVVLVGAALSVAGASYQGMFRNPLVSPDILGASTGASLGACFGLLLDMNAFSVQLLAFIGGMLAVGAAVWISRLVRYDATLGLVLGGILVSTLFQAGTSLIKFVADAEDKLPTITFWLMGSFSSSNNEKLLLALIPMALGFVLLLLQRWKLNVLSFGDEEARAMGVNTKRTRLLVILASTLLASISVAVAGVVGWVGLVIPHLARAVVGPNYKVLLPTSIFIGASYLLIVDNIARLVGAVEIPIGILTAILGVPFFVVIFRRNMKGWN